MKELTFVVSDDPEDGYTARALGQPIFTQAETWEELQEQIRDAVNCHFDQNKPNTIFLHYVCDEVVAA